jgi:hypothetical protein
MRRAHFYLASGEIFPNKLAGNAQHIAVVAASQHMFSASMVAELAEAIPRVMPQLWQCPRNK